MSRHSEIKAEKGKGVANGHEMGNVINVSPFSGWNEQENKPHPDGYVEYTVHSRCRTCGLGMYIEKAGGVVRSWGEAKDARCGNAAIVSEARNAEAIRQLEETDFKGESIKLNIPFRKAGESVEAFNARMASGVDPDG